MLGAGCSGRPGGARLGLQTGNPAVRRRKGPRLAHTTETGFQNLLQDAHGGEEVLKNNRLSSGYE